MYQAVVGGQVAACFDDTPIMASNIKDTGIAMKLVDGTGNDPAEYGFAIFDDSKQELVDMFNAGLSFKIGQGSGITTSKTAMAKKIESLEDTVDKQDKKIAELEALVKEQGEMIRQYVGKK